MWSGLKRAVWGAWCLVVLAARLTLFGLPGLAAMGVSWAEKVLTILAGMIALGGAAYVLVHALGAVAAWVRGPAAR